MKLEDKGYYWIRERHTDYSHGVITGYTWKDPEIARWNDFCRSWSLVGDYMDTKDGEHVQVLSTVIVLPLDSEIKAKS